MPLKGIHPRPASIAAHRSPTDVERVDLPLMMHSESSVYAGWPTNGLEYDTFLELHTLVHPLCKLWHATSAIAQGIPERYDVDLVFMEAGQPWIQLLANRMDREYVERPNEAPELTKLPSEYLKEFYYGTQPLEEPKEPEHLQTVIDMNGLEDQLVFTTDFPHMDFDAPSAVLDHPGLTDATKRKMLGENAERLFDF
jgi:predicted TIM-barrel fold metal-dependent hydrolase